VMFECRLYVYLEAIPIRDSVAEGASDP
jgi:hypothetical protein